MKSSNNQQASYIRLTLTLCAAFFLCATAAVADVRQDAESAYVSLHQNHPAVARFPDDMKSLDLVFEIAGRYSMVGEQENADKFYLLALQKSRIIEAMLKAPEVAPLPEMSDVLPQADTTDTGCDCCG